MKYSRNKKSYHYDIGESIGETVRKFIPTGVTMYKTVGEAIEECKRNLEKHEYDQSKQDYMQGKLKGLES
jgi:hypothetical protein